MYKNNPLAVPLGCLFLVACLATIFSINPVDSLLGNYKRYNGLISLAIYLCLVFMITNYVGMDMLDTFINAIIVSACISSVYGILQYYGIDYFTWNTDYGRRIFSTIGHPAFFSAYLIMVLPLVYYQVIKGKWYFLIALLLILITFYLTRTRATFVGLVISNVCFLALIGRGMITRYKYRLIAVFSIVLIVTVIANISMRDNPVSRLIKAVKITDSEVRLIGTASTRRYNVFMAMEIVKDYPLLGIGFGCIDNLYIPYMNKVLAKTGRKGYEFEFQDRIHSDFFDRTVNTGILGLGAYLFLIYSYIKMMRSQNEHRLFKAVMCSSLCAYFIQNQFSFGHVPIITLFWFLMGMSVIICRKNISGHQVIL